MIKGHKEYLNPSIIFTGLFLISLVLLYPGALTNDSRSQYQQAISGVFYSQHPPVMSYWWSWMMMVTKNPATMLAFHLILITSACYNFYKGFLHLDTKWRYVFYILPFSPLFFCYSLLIWKDVGFAYSYIYVISILTRVNIESRGMTKSEIFLAFLILWYGTSIKYQARFILPIMAFWLAKMLNYNKQGVKLMFCTVLIALSIYIAQFSANYLILVDKKQDHEEFWQYVKLYDLAGISISEDKMLFPEYILKKETLSKDSLKENYNLVAVDMLISKVLSNTKDPSELNSLWWFWLKTVIKYPKSYLKHRYLLFKTTIERPYWIPYPGDLENSKIGYDLKNDRIYKFYKKYLESFQKFSAFKFLILLLPFYLLTAIILKRSVKDARLDALVIINLMSLLFCLIMFIFTMASDARYIFFPASLALISSIIFLNLISELLQKKLLSKIDQLFKQKINDYIRENQKFMK